MIKTQPLRQSAVSVVHVAKLAGVSRATAARAFSDSDKVKPETLRKIIDAASRLNYTPNPLARGLRGGYTNSIGVVWSQTGDPTAATMIHRLATVFSDNGYITNTADQVDESSILKSLADFQQRGVDGIVFQKAAGNELFFSNFKAYLRKFKAVVLVTGEECEAEFDQLLIDRLDAYRSAAVHFAKTGRSKPMFIGAHISTDSKLEAFREVLYEYQIMLPRDNAIKFDFSREPLKNLTNILDSRFGDNFPFDSVMCINDTIAQVLMYWLSKKGIRVPDDTAVIGFNDTSMCPFTSPPLASVDRKTDNQIDLINRMLMKRLENPEIPRQAERISMEFVWRESAGE